MRLSFRTLALGTASLAAFVAAHTSASAGAFGLREQSAYGLGQSFAGSASGASGLSSMFWNPATVTMHPGWNSEYDATVIIPQATITPVSPTPGIAQSFGGSGDIGNAAVIPSSYTSYQINDSIFLGLASTAPFGLVTKPNQVWAGQTYARSSSIYALNFNPIVGIKVTDWLSIAAGPTIQYFKVKLRNATGLGPAAPSALLEGDDWGTGFTAGVTITPWAGTQFGVGYRSSIHHELDGTVRVPGAVVPVRLNLNLPEMVSVGLTQVITPDFRVSLGFEWSNWSRLGSPAIVGPSGGPLPAPLPGAFPLNYKDGYMYSLGGEYQWNAQWAFRAGVAYEEAPVSTTVRSPRLPDDNRIWASLGASYKYNEKLSFDLSYAHIFQAGSTKIDILPGSQGYSGLPFVADVDSSVDMVAVGLKYRWDNPATAIPAAPIVRKY